MTHTPSSRAQRRHGTRSPDVQRQIAILIDGSRKASSVGRSREALKLSARALALDSFNVDALTVFSELAVKAGQVEAAADAARRVVALQPEHPDGHYCLGLALRAQGHNAEATLSLGRAAELDPNRASVLFELCAVFLDQGDPDGATPFLERALELDPSSPIACMALGRYYRHTNRFDEAIAAYRRAVELDPNQADGYNDLGNLLRDAGDVVCSIKNFERSLALAPNRPDIWSNLLLTMQCADTLPARVVAQKHFGFGRHFGRLYAPLPAIPRREHGDRRLKIAYISSNMRRHALAKFFEPLLAAHDHSRFEIYCYYNFHENDDATQRIAQYSDHFASIWSKSDGHVAAMIRRDEVDILVDLDGHTSPNRLPVFLLRPAPVQASWVGYLSTSGIGAIDYRLTDVWADPIGIADELHSETLWRMTRCAWCYRPYDCGPLSERVPSSVNGFTTFVSLNNPGKVSPTNLSMWANVLRQLEGSRLIVHASAQPSRIANLARFFEDRGIHRDRVLIVGRQSIERYLATYGLADIALDTWPCAGGTTTCDALWMGVPVITLVGESSFSRTGASLLEQVGLQALVTNTSADYVATAVALAGDRQRLQELRNGLRARMEASPLLDAEDFARHLESAYIHFWTKYLKCWD